MTRDICTTHNRFNRSRIFDNKTKIKLHSRTGSTWFTLGIEVWSVDINVWFFFTRMDTKENKLWFGIWFSASFRPLRNTFCWYTSTFHRGWTSIKDWNMIHMYTQTVQLSECERWTVIVQLAARLCEEFHVVDLSLDVVWKLHVNFWNRLVSKIDSTFKTHVWSFCKN